MHHLLACQSQQIFVKSYRIAYPCISMPYIRLTLKANFSHLGPRETNRSQLIWTRQFEPCHPIATYASNFLRKRPKLPEHVDKLLHLAFVRKRIERRIIFQQDGSPPTTQQKLEAVFLWKMDRKTRFNRVGSTFTRFNSTWLLFVRISEAECLLQTHKQFKSFASKNHRRNWINWTRNYNICFSNIEKILTL